MILVVALDFKYCGKKNHRKLVTLIGFRGNKSQWF